MAAATGMSRPTVHRIWKAFGLRLLQFYEESGGFGKLLLVAGKDWGTRESRARSYRRFMEQVAPRLADLSPERVPEVVLA